MARIYVKGFAISCGIVVAALTLIIGTLNLMFFMQNGVNRAIAMIYMDCAPTMLGVVINSFWSFAFAACVGGAIAFLYNRILDESDKEIEEKIKNTALSIWEAKGKPEGTKDQDWKEAQRKVRGF